MNREAKGAVPGSSSGDAASLLAPHPVAGSRRTALLPAGVALLSPDLGVLLGLVASELILGVEGPSTNRAGVGRPRRFQVSVDRDLLLLGLSAERSASASYPPPPQGIWVAVISVSVLRFL